MPHEVLSLILGGGRGTRLYPLTMLRSKPAVPIAGKYRLIDIPISNCINSGCNRIYILTQFLSVSLHRHIANTYKFDPFSRGFVEVLAAQQTNEASDWYQGTADAVRQNIRYIHEDPCQHVMILSGDQLYRMDYKELLRTHVDSDADVTIAAIPVTAEQTKAFGILKSDEQGLVTGFVEKPQTADKLVPYFVPDQWIVERGLSDLGGKGRNYLASMGIYLFKREVMFKLLSTPPLATDFGREIFPRSISTHKVQAHLFDGFWEDVGTVKSYHETNVALSSSTPPFDFHQTGGVIYTRMRNLPASRVIEATLDQTLISDGCLIEGGSRIQHSVIGVRTQIGRNVLVRNSILIGADRFETAAEKVGNARRGMPNLGVGDDSLIDSAILDKDARVGKNVKIVNEGRVQEGEGTNFVIRDGVVVIPRAAVITDGTVI